MVNQHLIALANKQELFISFSEFADEDSMLNVALRAMRLRNELSNAVLGEVTVLTFHDARSAVSFKPPEAVSKKILEYLDHLAELPVPDETSPKSGTLDFDEGRELASAYLLQHVLQETETRMCRGRSVIIEVPNACSLYRWHEPRTVRVSLNSVEHAALLRLVYWMLNGDLASLLLLEEKYPVGRG